MIGSAWVIEERRGSVAALHAIEPPTDRRRHVWIMRPDASALVLGSTQSDELARPVDGLDVVVRRSGGGAVLVGRDDTAWIDVFVPRDDPLWDEDVNRSFFWLGETWALALATLGLRATVHRGALERTTWSRLVCFAGVGPGEVLVEGRKVVGLSQRRTRGGAKFQCVLYPAGRAGAVGETHGVGAGIGRIVDLLANPIDPAGRDALRAHLEAGTAAVPHEGAAIVAAFVGALPRS